MSNFPLEIQFIYMDINLAIIWCLTESLIYLIKLFSLNIEEKYCKIIIKNN